ncbi:hypothetical protein NG895_10565 [Aeoliella sp. ICT_H6.2]|uniref:PEP-CTERM protein-sorting domain-containing protein n=1 Tax=Aeoliella straminimaris TaxID=2954799 RepID=A0A9X2F9G8_9BACT|nr:hypothetical protein [Aeoliella straminimaris]MCO6044349.1 hypothetical protein [Aeoliella straminimaris]
MISQIATRHTSVVLAALLSVCFGKLVVPNCQAQILTPSNLFYNNINSASLNGGGVANSRANGFNILTNGVVDHVGQVDNYDTWNSDEDGLSLDFVGLQYDSTNRFDSITVELGLQFGDGGDWESAPSVYILKNPLLVGENVEPNLSPAWVEIAGATETTGHSFNPIVTPGAGGTIRFDLTSVPEADRVGWGWAVGGVDGNHRSSDNAWNFISLTEVFAEGEAAPIPVKLTPTVLDPVNVVSNAYHSPGAEGIVDWLDSRGGTFKSIDNDVILHNSSQDGYDTFQADGAGAITDFVGYQYNTLNRFDSVTVELATQFGDGGDWDSQPRVFVLKNPIDTNTTAPEDDPDNWFELVGATEGTGHVFDSLVTPGDGGTISFDLSSFPEAARTGWGIAVGGVDGNAAASGAQNFISVTEFDVTGDVIPGPYELSLEVNSSTGEVFIKNDAPFDVDLDFYKVTSASGSLDLSASGWNSLEDPDGNPGNFPSGSGSGDGWEKFGGLDSTVVAESYLDGATTMGTASSVSLGSLFAGGTEDLYFRYRTAGGVFIDAAVVYVSGGLPGDFNGDGTVDIADYVVWRNNLGGDSTALNGNGAGGMTVTSADYDLWKDHFGDSSAVSSTSPQSVPEPSAVILIAGLSLTLGLLRQRHR